MNAPVYVLFSASPGALQHGVLKLDARISSTVPGYRVFIQATLSKDTAEETVRALNRQAEGS